MSGFILLHRSTMKWEWYGDPNTTLVFIDLLLNASYKKSSFRGFDIKPGDVVYGRKEASYRIGISEQSIRTALNKLKSTNEITIKPTNKFSVITVVNWTKYQATNQQDNQPSTNHQPTTNHIQQRNNKTNKKTDDLFGGFEVFWKAYPKKVGKSEAQKKYKLALKAVRHETIMQGLENYKSHLAAVRAGGFNQMPKAASGWLLKENWNDEYETSNDGTEDGTEPKSQYQIALSEWLRLEAKAKAEGKEPPPRPQKKDFD